MSCIVKHNKARHFAAFGRSDVNCDAVAARALSVMCHQGEALKKYMVVENFKPGLMEENYKVYNAKGRQFPDGLYYLNSWVNTEKNICFQLMESNDESLFYVWFKKWEQFVDFELYPLD